jgi:hypothetical protein
LRGQRSQRVIKLPPGSRLSQTALTLRSAVGYCATMVRVDDRAVGHPLNLEAETPFVAFTISAALCCWILRRDLYSQPSCSLGSSDSYICRETRWRFPWCSEAPSNLGDSVRLTLPSHLLPRVGAASGFRPCNGRATAGGVALVHGGILRLCCVSRLTGAQRYAQAPFSTGSSI